MVDMAMRRVKHQLVRGLAARLGRHIGPMPITLAALVAGLCSALTAALGLSVLALMLWLSNRVLDGLDGEIARARGESSDFGGYVDMMCDVVIYAAIPLSVAWDRGDPAVTGALLLMMASFYANITSWSYLSALLEKRRSAPGSYETSVEMPRGLIEGTETIVVYAVLLALPGLSREVALLAAAAGAISTAQRILWAAGALRE